MASAIADMTADFYNAISANNTYDSISSTVPQKQPEVLESSGQPFDPFATIHDDETPKRQKTTVRRLWPIKCFHPILVIHLEDI